MVMASVDDDKPASIDACRAGDCPMPAEYTLPIYVAVINESGTEDFLMASRIAYAPSCGAETVAKEPLNYEAINIIIIVDSAKRINPLTLAVGVLAALKMYASLSSLLLLEVLEKCRCICVRRCFGLLADILMHWMARDILRFSSPRNSQDEGGYKRSGEASLAGVGCFPGLAEGCCEPICNVTRLVEILYIICLWQYIEVVLVPKMTWAGCINLA